MIDTSCIDWEDRLISGRSIIPPPIYRDAAEHALAIFKQLRVVDLPGKPTFGECADEFVFDFVRAVFGGYNSDTGQQVVREYFLLIAKKNTKSSVAAGIMLTALILCWREDEEHLILSPTKEVADNSFKPIAGMIRVDTELAAMFHVQDHIRTITHRVMKSSIKVVAADTDTVSGKKSGRVLVDEFWLFGKRANADARFLEALGGQISRPEGWVIYLTTQSDDPPAGVFKEKLDYFRNVRDGKIKDSKSLPILYEFPQSMIESKAYLDPKNFRIANPNIGRSVSQEWLEDQLLKCQHKSDGSFQIFLAKHLNIEIGLRLRNDRWTAVDFWEENAQSGITVDSLIERSDVICAGIDGGGLDDLLGFALVGRDKDTHEWLVWTHAWAHPSVLERRKSEESKFRDFAKDGDLTIVERVGDDVSEISALVSRVYESGLLDRVGVDQHGLGGILDALMSVDIPEEVVIGISQGWKMVSAIKATERKLAEGMIKHSGSKMMAWCMSNARIVPAGNAVMITKAVSGTAKIDPVIAMLNAATLMALNPSPKRSFWETLDN